MEVWIARDSDGVLYMFRDKPQMDVNGEDWEPISVGNGGGFNRWPDGEGRFPEVKPGQCRAARIELSKAATALF